MRIAIVSDCYLPRLGGIEVQTSELARRLALAGNHVEFFTLTPGRDDPSTPYAVHRFPPYLPLPGNMLINPLAGRTLRDRLETGAFDVVHSQFGILSPFSWESVRLALSLRVPVAMTWHSLVGHVSTPLKALGWVDAWGGRGAALSAVSRVAAEGIRRGSRHGVQVAVLPNGIDLAEWWAGSDPAQAQATMRAGEARAATGTVRVVSAMRLAPRKRPMALLDIMRQARRLAPGVDIRLDLIGDGQLRHRIARSVADHGDEGWVALPGRLPREELRRRYAEADLYVSPVKLEAFGIAALEARCCGLPIVGQAGSGISEFVDDGEGGVLAPGDTGLAAEVARLASDPGAREAMRRHNLTVAPEHLDWPQVLEMTLAEYARAGAE